MTMTSSDLYRLIAEEISKDKKYLAIPFDYSHEFKMIIAGLRANGYIVEINELDSIAIIHWGNCGYNKS